MGRSDATDWYNGTIYQVDIWDIDLTDGEIKSIYNSKIKRQALQLQPDNLVASWSLNECSDGVSADGVTWKDLSGNGNDLTGDDGGGDAGYTCKAEIKLSYP